MIRRTLAVLALASATPALAEGDATSGKRDFNKCKSCHTIVSDAGDTIVRGGRTGPNLWGLPGRQAGVVEGFRYGDDIVAAGAAGLVWDEEQFVSYVQDPRAFLRDTLGDSSARSKMTFKLNNAQDAADIWAYLASLSE